MRNTTIKFVNLELPEHINNAKKLFQEYADSRPGDPALVGFAGEIAGLPGEYSFPKGCFLLAFYEDEAVGCVALREWSEEIAEMKRLFVKPSHQGLGIGRMLAEALINQAKIIGYSRIRLDTIPGMIKAQALYKGLGFTEIEPYRHNPNKGTSFLELQLNRS